MATLISDRFRITAALDFINKYKYDFGSNGSGSSAGLSNYLYFMLGKTTQWANENAPDAVVNNQAEIDTKWTNAIALAQINNNDVELVVPRYSWQEMASGAVTGVPFSTTTSNAYATPFYCLNTDLATLKASTSSSNNVNDFHVYQLTAVGGGLPTIRPIHTTGSVTGSDGFSWTYLYTLTTYQIDNMVTETATGAGDWLPVPYVYTGSTLDAGTASAADTTARLLGASNVMLRRIILDTEIDVTVLTSFREVSLVSNPTDVAGTARANVPQGFVNQTTNHFSLNSGETIYTETRKPIYRTSGQTEEIKLVLDF